MCTQTVNIKKSPLGFPGKNHCETVPLYPGVELFRLDLSADSLPLPHRPSSRMIQINYCRAGKATWKTDDGGSLCLESGSFSLCAGKSCTDSVLMFPTGHYQGLVFCVDLLKASAQPPDPLADTDLFRSVLWDKFSQTGTVLFPAGSTQAENIFSGFYDLPGEFRLPYQRIKFLELLLYLAEMGNKPEVQTPGLPSEQVRIVREIHDHLLLHIDRRVTIEELSRQYLINPTTLKAAFKSVYGTSIAAHVKEHRMEQAARWLKDSDMSIAEIAQAVGYDSPSKFTVAFKSFFQALPREYRKKAL